MCGILLNLQHTKKLLMTSFCNCSNCAIELLEGEFCAFVQVKNTTNIAKLPLVSQIYISVLEAKLPGQAYSADAQLEL